MVLDSLARTPQFTLAHLPTPLVRTRRAWGERRLYVKRDDLTGCALTGNKVRKLEFLIADAQRRGADTLLTCGGVQSNCARAAAIAAAQLDMHCVLLLTGDEPAQPDGNLLIDRLTGAHVHFLPGATGRQRDAALLAMDEELRSFGRRPYLIPFGGSSDVGTLGYVQAAFEIAQQVKECGGRIGEVLVAIASGGSYAGLLLGFRLAGMPCRVVGAVVEGNLQAWPARILELTDGAAKILDGPMNLAESDVDLLDARGLGYGRPSPAELDFIADFIRDTGIIVDPVYTGKALFAYDAALAAGRQPADGDVLFVHTGGAFSVFPYRDGLLQALERRDQPREAIKLPRSPVLTNPRVAPSAHRISIASPYE